MIKSMSMKRSRSDKTFQALTIIRRGRLSKTHLADPKSGLSDEDKKAQELPVKVSLIQVAELDQTTLTKMVKPEDAPKEVVLLEGEEGPNYDRAIESEEGHDPHALPGDVNGNVA